MQLAEEVGLRSLADRFLTVPTDKGANPGLKVSSLVAGMVAGEDSIDDVAILRHGGMRNIFDAVYAPSTSAFVSAAVHLRSCPAVGRGGLPDVGSSGRCDTRAQGNRR